MTQIKQQNIEFYQKENLIFFFKNDLEKNIIGFFFSKRRHTLAP